MNSIWFLDTAACMRISPYPFEELSAASSHATDSLTAVSSKRRPPPTRSADIALYGIYEISKALTAPGELDATLGRVVQLLSSFLDMRHGLIALLAEDGTAQLVVGSGWTRARAERHFGRLPERVIGQIVVTQVPLVVLDVEEDPLFEGFDLSEWGESRAEVAFVGVPIKDQGRVIGTLTIDRDRAAEPHFRLDEDVRFLAMVANLVGQTVRLHRLLSSEAGRPDGGPRRILTARADTRLESPPIDCILGGSAAIRAVLDKVRRVARTHSTVLIRGESGTGKELVARALHDLSPRRDKPFVSVNCAALAESVLESELFGHEKGAFTGAASQRKGRFELADGGTLLLDEIGEISPPFQAKLLRVLQQGDLERVGGTTTLRVDVRVIAATNRNLEEAVARGDFRADLYYRVSVVPIFVPPLRERKEDIGILALAFLRRFNLEHASDLTFCRSALETLTSCSFPGNVRELENCVRRTATLAEGPSITRDDFACQRDGCPASALWSQPKSEPAAALLPQAPLSVGAYSGCSACAIDPRTAPLEPGPAEPNAPAVGFRSDAERERLVAAMNAAGWVQAKAARLLHLTPRQIGYALRRHNIPIKKF
ncbi:MAG: nif-specific transcriptional activator NifA [Polyangiaceae bacterium]|jgi:Nif-specific regulatory protein